MIEHAIGGLGEPAFDRDGLEDAVARQGLRIVYVKDKGD
jgi:hypothetical protein